jgi:MoaD family protein
MSGNGIRVRLVSLLREAVGGAREVVIEAEGERTLEEVLEDLFRRYPRLRSLIEELEQRDMNIVYMVNGSSAEPGARLRPGDVLTILPPASGG